MSDKIVQLNEKVIKTELKEVAAMLKAIHAQEDKKAVLKKVDDVLEKLGETKLPKKLRMLL